MKKILVVEDSKFFASMIDAEIRKTLPWGVVHVEDLFQAQRVLDDPDHDIAIMVLDLGLPGSTRRESLDFSKKTSLPVIVYTGTFSNELGTLLRSYNIVDYILKDNPGSLKYLVDIIHRILKNQHERVLVVDDSSTSRLAISKLLNHFQLETVEAESGKQALQILKKDRGIRLVITDYNMPMMNGFELASRIRVHRSIHELAIIGVSSFTDTSVSTRFLKSGANDFINKPFVPEEFFCRICQNLSQLDMYSTLENAANTDPLTQLYNRRYFYHQVQQLLTVKDDSSAHAMALLDIDFFKKINDTHGHAVGDEVLKQIAQLLQQVLANQHDSDDYVLARFGGEEFCLFFAHIPEDQCQAFFEKIRKTIEDHTFRCNQQSIKITMSIGVCLDTEKDIDTMLNAADQYLYGVKLTGRNRVVSGNNAPS